MLMQLYFYFNQATCMGCNACMVACKDKNNLSAGIQYRRLTESTTGGYVHQNEAVIPSIQSFYTSIACNHCSRAKCVENCPTTAMHKSQDDGTVAVDHNKCVGCRYCVWACPYGAPQYNESIGKMTKCDMCRDLRQRGEKPACVSACPISALDFGTLEEMRSKYGNVIQIETGRNIIDTNPNMVLTPHKNSK